MREARMADQDRGEVKQLGDVRREIDAIDAQMHGLLMERTELVRQVAEAKAQAASDAGEGSFIAFRPGREAEVLRALAARHQGPLPLAVIFRLWREIMSAKTRLQGPLRVEVFGGADPLRLWDLARGYYGSFTPMNLREEAMDVLRRVSKDRSVIGVLPAPQPDDGDAWWAMLGRGDTAPVRVVACLPFLTEEGVLPEAYAVAQADFEETGADTSLVVLTFSEAVSAGAVEAQLQEAGLAGTLYLRKEQNGQYYALIGLTGFISAGDGRLETLYNQDGIDGVQLIGGYADPVRLAGCLEKGE